MRRVTERHRPGFWIGAAGAMVALLSAGVTPGFAQQSVAVRAVLAKGALPTDDPNAAIWNTAPQASFPMSPQVHWQNRIQEVTVKGSTIKVELNGSTILDTDLSKITEYMAKSPHPGKERTEGFFGFAGHGDAVEFRNIRITKLK